MAGRSGLASVPGALLYDSGAHAPSRITISPRGVAYIERTILPANLPRWPQTGPARSTCQLEIYFK